LINRRGDGFIAERIEGLTEARAKRVAGHRPHWSLRMTEFDRVIALGRWDWCHVGRETCRLDRITVVQSEP